MKLAHLSLAISDTAQTERFYRDVLGLDVRRAGDALEVRWPDFLLVFSERPPAERSKFHFGFRVENRDEVDTWANRLREQQVQIISGPSSENGTRQLFFLDPDQYVVEIYAE